MLLRLLLYVVSSEQFISSRSAILTLIFSFQIYMHIQLARSEYRFVSHSRVACELTTSRCELVSGRHSSSKAHPSFASAVCIMVCCSLLYMAAMVAVVTEKHQWNW